MDTLSLPPTQSLLPSIKTRLAQQLDTASFDLLQPEEKAEAAQNILLWMNEHQNNLTLALLQLLNEIRTEALWLYLKPNLTFLQWCDDLASSFDPMFSRQFMAAANGVERVLALVQEREFAGDPIFDDSGEAITVDRLLEVPSKVRNFSSQVAYSDDPETWVRAIVSKTNGELELMRRNGKPELPQVPAQVRKEEGHYILTLVLSPENLRVIERLLKKMVSFPVVEGV